MKPSPFKTTIAATCLSSAFIATSHAAAGNTELTLNQQNITAKFTYEQYSLPNNQPSLGVLGSHGLINFTQNWYGGLGLYGGVKGNHGGYFALSLDGGYQHQLYKKLWADLGASLGAGGGRSTPVGGGFYIEPHAGLSLHFKVLHIGASYSYINFTSGDIRSHQWGVNVSIPTSVTTTDPDLAGQTLSNSTPLNASQNSIGLLLSNYTPNKGTHNTSGQISDNNIQLVGIEAAHYFDTNWFAFGQAKGAFHGRSNGYADALVGPGYRYTLSQNKHFALLGKFGVGSGGGGGVNTAGGFILQPQLGVDYRLTQSIAVEIDGGYLTAPAGDFNNWTANLYLKYNFEQASIHSSLDDNTLTHWLTQGWRIRVLNQTYFSPRATNGSTNPTMQLVNLNFDHDLNRWFYTTGQTAFAYKGQSTGGYFSGMLGLGGQWPAGPQHKFAAFAEALVGTAGGAGLDIGSGALYEPVVGLQYKLSKHWQLQTSVGRLMAFTGKFHTTTLNAGLGYYFATLSA